MSRTVAMVEKYNDGVIPSIKIEDEFDASLKELALMVADKVEGLMDKLNFSGALEEIWKLVRRTNKYVDETMPWILAKDDNHDRLDTVLYNLSESLRITSILIKPFMEKTSAEIRKQLGIEEETVWNDAKVWNPSSNINIEGNKVVKGQII